MSSAVLAVVNITVLLLSYKKFISRHKQCVIQY